MHVFVIFKIFYFKFYSHGCNVVIGNVIDTNKHRLIIIAINKTKTT